MNKRWEDHEGSKKVLGEKLLTYYLQKKLQNEAKFLDRYCEENPVETIDEMSKKRHNESFAEKMIEWGKGAWLESRMV